MKITYKVQKEKWRRRKSQEIPTHKRQAMTKCTTQGRGDTEERDKNILEVPTQKPRGREGPFCILFSLHWLWDRTNKPQEPFGKLVWLLVFLGGPWNEAAVVFRVLRRRFGGTADGHNNTEDLVSHSTDFPNLALPWAAHGPFPIDCNPCVFERKYNPHVRDSFALYVTKCGAVTV